MGLLDVPPLSRATLDARYSRSSPLATLAARLKNGDALKLGICGSSTVAGLGLAANAGTGYQCWSQVMTRYGNTAATITNTAVSGAKADDIYRGGSIVTSVEVMSAEAAVRTYGLDAIIYNINYNDGGTLTAAQFGDLVRKGILAARRAGAVVLYIPPFAYSPYFTQAYGPQYRLAGYKAAAQAGAVVMPIELLNTLPDGSNLDPQWYQGDLTHPNTAGAARYGAAFTALWPSEVGATATVPHQPARTFDDPAVAGRFLTWLDTLGVERRTAGFPPAAATDGFLATKGVSLEPATFARNTVFCSDLRLDPASTGGQALIDNASSTEAPGYSGLNATASDAADPTFLSPAGATFGTGKNLVVPAATKRRLAPGRDDFTVRVVIKNAPTTPPDGAGQVLFGRAFNTSGVLLVYLGSDNKLYVICAATSNSYGASTLLDSGAAAHLVTVTGKSGATRAQVYIDGTYMGEANIGTDLTQDNLDWIIGSRWVDTNMSTGTLRPFGGSMYWLDIAASYTNATEEQSFRTNVLKPLLNAAPRSIGLA